MTKARLLVVIINIIIAIISIANIFSLVIIMTSSQWGHYSQALAEFTLRFCQDAPLTSPP